MITDDQKKWIDEASYKSLLLRWRHAQLGDPIFQGEAGTYYSNALAEKRTQVGDAAHVKASKEIGW